MARDVTIPQRLDRYGVPRSVMKDFATHGTDTLDVQLIVVHATVSNPGRNTPSLGIVHDGRHDVPGPLYNTLGGRDHTTICVASGKANNAGKGGIFGVTGNSRTLGFAFEHTNILSTEGFGDDDLEFVARNAAALAHGHVGADRIVCHWEFAGGRQDPAGAYRKSDLLQRHRIQGRELAAAIRHRAAQLLAQGGAQPKPVEVWFPAFPGQMQVGSRGKHVEVLKFIMASVGYGGFVSFKGNEGQIFGSGTEAGVKKIQQDRNVLHAMSGGRDPWPVTGRVGPKTWGYLRWLNHVKQTKG